MPRFFWSAFWVLFYLGLTCLVSIPAGAAEHVINPSVRARETYDDNVFFIDMTDFEHLIAPTIELNSRTERTSLNATATWNISEYERHSQFDTVDQSYQLSGGMSLTSRAQLELSGNYIRDYTFNETLEELGVVAERSVRTTASVQPRAIIEWTPRNRIEAVYDFNKTQYRLDRYPDYRAHGLSLTWTHDQMNERTSIIVQLGGSQVDYAIGDEDLRQQTLQGLIGINHRFTEAFQVTLQGGARYTDSRVPKTEFIFVPPYFVFTDTKTVRERDTGFILYSQLGWRSERMTVSAEVMRDFIPSIYGEDMTRDRVRASLRYQFLEHFQCGFTGAYYHSQTEGLIRTQERETYSARPMINYRFSEHARLELGYAYTKTKDEITEHSDERNQIFVQVRAEWPYYN